MAYRVVKRADVEYRGVDGVDGFSIATLVGAAHGSVHMEFSLCRLAAGSETPPLLHAFEESWYVLDGSGAASVADLTFDVAVGSFGMIRVRLFWSDTRERVMMRPVPRTGRTVRR